MEKKSNVELTQGQLRYPFLCSFCMLVMATLLRGGDLQSAPVVEAVDITFYNNPGACTGEGPIVSNGWSDPAATNAPVADEPVEAIFRMNENPILPARIYIFFPPLLYPKIFPPPTYHLPTPPPPHSITRAPETSSRSELGARELRGELGARAWINELGAGERLEPELDPHGSRSGTHVAAGAGPK